MLAFTVAIAVGASPHNLSAVRCNAGGPEDREGYLEERSERSYGQFYRAMPLPRGLVFHRFVGWLSPDTLQNPCYPEAKARPSITPTSRASRSESQISLVRSMAGSGYCRRGGRRRSALPNRATAPVGARVATVPRVPPQNQRVCGTSAGRMRIGGR